MSSCCCLTSRHRVAFTLAAIVLLTVMGPRPASAQPGRVATLSEVRGLTTGDACKALPAPGQRTALSRVRNGRREPAWPTDVILAADRLTVQPQMDVRVIVEPPLGTGAIYLTPDLGRCASSANALKARGLPTPEGAASYRFNTEGEGAQRQVSLVVEHGSVVVEWTKGPLIVYAGARRLEVRGTRFVVIVDSVRQTAGVYVLEGVVAFVGAGALTASAREGILFRPTGAVRVPALDVGFLDDVRHKSRTVWGVSDRPLGGNALRWIIGGAAVAGAGWWVMSRPEGNDRGRVPARVNIRIPF